MFTIIDLLMFTLGDAEARDIKVALLWWQKATCLTFVEVGVNAPVEEQHLFFFKLLGYNGYADITLV